MTEDEAQAPVVLSQYPEHPAGQVVQLDFPANEYVPSVQVLQLPAPTAEYVPAAQV